MTDKRDSKGPTALWRGLGQSPRIVASAALGLMIPTVGLDVGTGAQRYSMGITALYGGIDFKVLLLGLCLGWILDAALKPAEDLAAPAPVRPGIRLAGIRLAVSGGIFPVLAVAAFVGAYLVNYRLFDMYLLAAVGAFGLFMRRLGIPLTPLVICAALGPSAEEAYRAARPF